jgi:hypothetical protein
MPNRSLHALNHTWLARDERVLNVGRFTCNVLATTRQNGREEMGTQNEFVLFSLSKEVRTETRISYAPF